MNVGPCYIRAARRRGLPGSRPDLRPGRPAERRGAERAAVLVVEILSPGDETYDKLDWYAAGGVDEVLVVDPHSCQAEVFGRRGSRMAAFGSCGHEGNAPMHQHRAER
jgi:Uma2 family endonuclease